MAVPCVCEWSQIPMMSLTSLFLLCFPVAVLAQLFQPDTVAFKTPVNITTGLSASVIFSNLTSPRGITFDTQQNLLVVERGVGISALTRTVSPLSGWTRSIVVSSDAFTHGIQVDGNTLYVSTASDVLVYKYDPTTKKALTPPSCLIAGLPADGGDEAMSTSLFKFSDSPLSRIDDTHPRART